MPEITRLREPEAGLAMVRGSMDASGEPFNLGEVTVARASVTLTDGTVGHGYVLGRSLEHAEWVAIYDALAQLDAFAQQIDSQLLDPTERDVREQRDRIRRKAGATHCTFETLVRESPTS